MASLTNLPNEILYEILNKSDTSSTLQLNKTCKKFNHLIKNDYEDNKIVELNTDVFKLEIIFYLKLSISDYFELETKIHNIYNYINLIIINGIDNVKDILNFNNKDQTIELSLRMNIITYDINQFKQDFNRFLDDYNLYEIIMETYKEYELLTYISIEQEIQIQKLKEKNKKFKFNGVGNKDEFERIFSIINNNIRTNDLKFVNNMKWLAMETTLNTMNTRNLERKKMIGLNLDLTI